MNHWSNCVLCLCVLSAMSKRCQNLLLQIYLHFPEIIQHVTLPEGTFSSGGAAYGTKCKVSWCKFLSVQLQTAIMCAVILMYFSGLSAGRAGAPPGHAARRHVRVQVCRKPHF